MTSLVYKLVDQRVTMRSVAVAAMVAMQILLTIACALAVRQISTLRERAETYRKWTAPLVGRAVPTITGFDGTGARKTVEYNQDQKPTLIYSFSEHCGACQANWEALKSVQRLSPDRLRIVYVDLKDELADIYLIQHGLTRDALFTKLDPLSEVSYQVRATPQTELVDRAGRVMWTSVGAFRPDDLAAFMAAIEKHERQSVEVNKGAGR